jgi:hypothetical protein
LWETKIIFLFQKQTILSINSLLYSLCMHMLKNLAHLVNLLFFSSRLKIYNPTIKHQWFFRFLSVNVNFANVSYYLSCTVWTLFYTVPVRFWTFHDSFWAFLVIKMSQTVETVSWTFLEILGKLAVSKERENSFLTFRHEKIVFVKVK